MNVNQIHPSTPQVNSSHQESFKGNSETKNISYASMLEPYSGLKTVDIFEACHSLNNGTLKSNPYSTDSMTPEQKIVRHVLNDYVLVKLLQIWLHTANKAKNSDIERAFRKVNHFIGDNGPNSIFLKGRLKEIEKSDHLKSILLEHLPKANKPGSSAHIATKQLRHDECTQIGISLTKLIPDSDKIPYQLSGLRHTLFCLDRDHLTWYESYQRYDMRNKHDSDSIGKLHSHFHSEQLSKTDHNTQISELLLGEGSSAKVKLVLRVKDGQLLAQKKFLKLKYYIRDFERYQKLYSCPDVKTNPLFNVPVAMGLSVSKKDLLTLNKKLTDNGLAILPLAASKNNMHQLITIHTNYRENRRRSLFENSLLNLIDKLITFTIELENNNLIHTDFKFENTSDSILDCLDLTNPGDFKKTLDNYALYTFTTSYHMPHSFKDNVNIDTLASYNRWALGIMLIETITLLTPSRSKMPGALALPISSELNKAHKIKDDETGFVSRGFNQKELSSRLDSILINRSKLTAFEQAVLLYGRLLSADNRKIAMKVKLPTLIKTFTPLVYTSDPKKLKDQINLLENEYKYIRSLAKDKLLSLHKLSSK